MLELNTVTKDYATPRGPLRILSDVSLSLAPGDAAAIMGPSGSGKSTLLYMLGALEPPTSGTDHARRPQPVSSSTRRCSPRSATSRSASCFRTTACCRSARVLENVLIPTLVARSGEDATARARTLSNRSGSAAAPTTGRRRCRAANGSAPRSPGRSSGGRACCCATSPPAISTAHRRITSQSVLFDLHRHQQTILIIVTHSAQLASKCPIHFELTDKTLARRT